jgi:hypothetical protein
MMDSKKLRRINGGAADAATPGVFWRGLADATVSADSVMAERGTELGCLSTTVSEDQVRKWATPLLFKVMASWGVDISWLSMYARTNRSAFFFSCDVLNFKGRTVSEGGSMQVEVHPSWPS